MLRHYDRQLNNSLADKESTDFCTDQFTVLYDVFL